MTSPNDPIAAMAEWATRGAGPVRTTIEANVASVLESIEGLRRHNTPATNHVADKLEVCLQEGGDLTKLLGLRPGRGRSTQAPHRAAETAIVRSAIRMVAAALPVDLTQTMRATLVMKFMLESKDPAVAVFREEANVPTSVRQIIRVIRGALGR